MNCNSENILTCKICGYKSKQLHQHLKLTHSISSAEYRTMFGADEIMQLGWNSISEKHTIDVKQSAAVKDAYKRISDRVDSADLYCKEELRDILLHDERWKKYTGKTKYRSMIKDDVKMYKSILVYTQFVQQRLTLEEKMKLIVYYNYDSESAKCECGRKLTFGKFCRKCSSPKRTWVGRTHSAETRLKQRLSTISYLESLHGQLAPRYNKSSISIIEQYGKEHGYNFQHAENGGEYHIGELGYWVDGYDKEKNVVIEIDESYHFQNDGSLTKRDIQRQSEIEKHLNCKFVRIRYENK